MLNVYSIHSMQQRLSGVCVAASYAKTFVSANRHSMTIYVRTVGANSSIRCDVTRHLVTRTDVTGLNIGCPRTCRSRTTKLGPCPIL